MKTDLQTIRTRRQAARRPNGFTLMELLIVISIMLILMLLAIPSYRSIVMSVNETSAMNSLQAITKAQTQYSLAYPAQGFGCKLSDLGTDPGQATPTPTASRLLQGDLPTGIKSGYAFTMTCKKADNSDRVVAFEVTAVPLAIGSTGKKGYCMDSNGEIKVDPAGGTNCTQLAQ